MSFESVIVFEQNDFAGPDLLRIDRSYLQNVTVADCGQHASASRLKTKSHSCGEQFFGNFAECAGLWAVFNHGS